MSYSNPKRVSYSFPALNFAAAATRYIKAPKGCTRANIAGIMCSVTTLFTQTTTPGYFNVDDAVTTGRYASLNMGAAAAGTALCDGDVAGSIPVNGSSTGPLDAGIDFDRDNITQIRVQAIAPTGGTPAGVADVHLTIDWF